MEINFNKSVAHLTLPKSVIQLEVQSFNDLHRDHIQWSSKPDKMLLGPLHGVYNTSEMLAL